MPLKIINAILCDSVRTEDNGKHILVGVYSGGVVFPEFPAKFSFAFWVQLMPPIESGEALFEMKVQLPGLKAPMTNEMTLLVTNKDEPAVLVIVLPSINIPGPGNLIFSMRRRGEKWKKVLSKTMSQNESALPSS